MNKPPSPAPTPTAVIFIEVTGAVVLEGCSDSAVPSRSSVWTAEICAGAVDVARDATVLSESVLADASVFVGLSMEVETCESAVTLRVGPDVKVEVDDDAELFVSFLIQNSPLRNPLPCLSDAEPKASTARMAKGKLLFPRSSTVH